MENLIKGVESEHWGDINEFNKKEVAKRKDWELNKLVDELIDTGNNFTETYQKLGDILLNKIISNFLFNGGIVILSDHSNVILNLKIDFLLNLELYK